VLVMAMTMLVGLLGRLLDEPSPTPTAQTGIQPARSIHFGADLC
jgi:hypothetical protein